MYQYISMVALVVRDYDEAIQYYCEVLGLKLLEDRPQESKRWVVVSPPGSRETRLLLARASNPEQEAHIGNQTGGRVFLFLQTDNFARDFDVFTKRGVAFIETPREESYGTVAVFRDLYGNRWDLVELR